MSYFLEVFFFLIYVSIYFWLHRVLVVAFRLLITSLAARQHMGSCHMWDLRSLTRDQTCIPCTGRQILDLQTTGEVPKVSYYRKSGTCFRHSIRCNIALKCMAVAVCFQGSVTFHCIDYTTIDSFILLS